MLERKRELQDELRHIACVSGYECRDLIMTNDIHLKEKKFDKQVTINRDSTMHNSTRHKANYLL